MDEWINDELNKIEMEEIDPGINDQIDAAYRRKYGRYPQYVAPMLTTEVRQTTLKLVPRASG